jgi:MFS family permease
VTLASRASTPEEARRQLAWLSVAMFLGMTLWFSATAATAPIIAEFRLTPSETAWLTMAVQGGFVIGTLFSAVMTLPDVFEPRGLFTAGCLCGGIANALLAVASEPLQLVALRFVTGISLALVYPTGMKVAAGWFERRRGAALGVVVGALTVGSAFPHLLAAISASIPWRVLMLAASALAIIGGGIVKTMVDDGPYVSGSSGFEASAALQVLRDRATRLATLGYLGHMWELYAFWTWVAAFVTASLYPSMRDAATPASRAGSLLAFVVIGSGAIGSVAAGLRADVLGKSRVARIAMIVSSLCCALAGFVFFAPAPVLTLFAIVWGVAVIADSGQLSALVAEFSPRHHVGTALTVQTCLGFLLTMVSIRLVPLIGRTVGWQWSFLLLMPGPALGAFALRTLDDRNATGRSEV